MFRITCSFAIAAALAAGGLVLAIAGVAGATPAASLLQAVAWNRPGAPGLIGDPLSVLSRPPGAGLDVEWAPLYRGTGGERLEQRREVLHANGRRGAWSGALELESRRLDMSGTGGRVLAEASVPQERRFAAGVGHKGSRHRAAAGIGLGVSGAPDATLALDLTLAPGWRAGWNAALESHRGGLTVRYDDAEATGSGAWSDRSLRFGLEGAAGSARLSVGVESLDREPGAGSFANPLAWRAYRAGAVVPAAGVSWAVTLEHGSGHERFELRRSGVRYARIVTPLSTSRVALGLTAPGSPIAARLWSGRWSGEPDGTLGLWAFDGLAALAGSRQVMRSEVAVAHAGVAIESRARRSPLETGLAVWWIRPEASYESWLAPVMGVGREDVQEGRLDVRSMWLGGARLATSVRRIGLEWRIEAMQWVPLAIRRMDSPAGPGDEPHTPAGPANEGAAPWGGTVLRFGVATR